MNFAGEKIIKRPIDHPEHCIISRHQFCKEVYGPGTLKFTFWDWLYELMKLIQNHLKEPWNDGKIHGLISKDQVSRLLINCTLGTFLLRFSDSVLGK